MSEQQVIAEHYAFSVQEGDFEQACLSCNSRFKKGKAIIWVQYKGFSYRLGFIEGARCPTCKPGSARKKDVPWLFASVTDAVMAVSGFQEKINNGQPFRLRLLGLGVVDTVSDQLTA